VSVQQSLISDWGVLLNWEKANGTFTVSKPPTAQAILGVGYGMSLVMFEEENKLYWTNEAGFPVLPSLVLYNEIQYLNSAFVFEQGNLSPGLSDSGPAGASGGD
jgi:hypothetical protein